MIKDFIHERIQVTQFDALRPDDRRAEVCVHVFEIAFDHRDRIRVLKKRFVQIFFAVIFFTVVDVADDIIAVRKFEDAGKRRKQKPFERRKFCFESEKGMRIIAEHEA